MKSLLVLIGCFVVVESLLIYRPKPRPKLLCYAVPPASSELRSTPQPDEIGPFEIASSDANLFVDSTHPTPADQEPSPIRAQRLRRDTAEIGEIDLDQAVDIEFVGATDASKYRDEIRKKLVRTCESLHNVY